MKKASWSEFLGLKNALPMFAPPEKARSASEATTCDDDFDTTAIASLLEVDDKKRAEEFLDAAKEGNLEELRRLCEALEVDPDVRGYMGWTAAHWAAREGFIHILEYLRDVGANLDSLDRKVRSHHIEKKARDFM